MREKRAKALVLTMVAFAAVSGFAFSPIPKESAKALGVTRGKPFSAGLVFVNGKFIEPPYVVERWGTGIRINQRSVTSQVIDWTDFLKTQQGLKVEKQESAPASGEMADAAVPSPAVAAADDDSSLDDLFDDDPKPAKKKPAPVRKPVIEKPKAAVTYALEGEFVPNDASRALVARINAVRTDIDRVLRAGGFICFGDNYSQVRGDARMLKEMLTTLPELMQNARDEKDFAQKVRAARMYYLNELLQADIFRNRVDYRKLKELRTKLGKDDEYKKVLEEVAQPLF